MHDEVGGSEEGEEEGCAEEMHCGCGFNDVAR